SDLSNYARSQPANKMREIITNPDQYLGPRNRTTTVTTQDGKQYTGIARNEDNFSLQLQTLDGAFHLFMKSEVTSVDYQPNSLMPSDYGSRLRRQDLDDLISYLMEAAGENNSTSKLAPRATKRKRPD